MVVREHVRAVTPFTITVSDFGWFSDDPADQTLYLNVVQNPQLAVFAYALTEAVKTATKGWMRKRVGGKEFHPHISLARHLSHDTTKQVSRFVAREGHKRFENVLLDPLTLFRVEGSSYVVETDFKLAYA